MMRENVIIVIREEVLPDHLAQMQFPSSQTRQVARRMYCSCLYRPTSLFSLNTAPNATVLNKEGTPAQLSMDRAGLTVLE